MPALFALRRITGDPGALRPAWCRSLPDFDSPKNFFAAFIGAQRMFGNERRTAIKQRAKLMGRMVMLLTDGLCTKSYDQFVERFSNPGDEPNENARNARISQFAMRFSPTCWYEATASLYENAQPWILIEGAGDDCGVVISVRVPADANVPSCPEVDLHVP